MDPEDIQLEQGSSEQAPQQSGGEEDSIYNKSNQVFDISNDSILPASNDEYVPKPEAQEAASIAQPVTEADKRASPPPDIELLDSKIGAFDATPFGMPLNPSPTQRNTRPATQPKPINTPAPQTVPNKEEPRVYREEIGASDMVLPSANLYMRPATPRPPIKQPTPVVQKPKIVIDERSDSTPTVLPTQRKNLQEEIASTLGSKIGMQQQSAPTPSPAQKPATPQPATDSHAEIKPIRTYEGDVAEAMSHKRTSVASIAIAESKRQQNEPSVSTNEEPSHAAKKIIMFVISIILLGGGAYGAYYLYLKSALAPVQPVVTQPKTAPSIVPSDSQSIVSVDLQNQTAIVARIMNEMDKAQAPSTIKEIVLSSKNSNGATIRVSAPELIKSLDINMPSVLQRSLAQNWMLGSYTDPDGVKSLFVITTTNFFQNTFSGMLEWEQVMADDLRRYLFPTMAVQGVSNQSADKPRPDPLQNINGILPTTGTSTKPATTTTISQKAKTATTTSATSTPDITQPLRQYITVRGKFEDRIVKNKDVRAFRTDTGKILFIYSFIDSAHLIVTDKESTLAEVLNRLEKQSFIR